ncbi:uncharacterized protein PHALS_12935 [Plasmopara halstedii]|uniref:Uncharacterized protein n=1 Tax=Plasmopara halstedii TaxID=4781 RepID=A0A0P1ANV6_PLAHL|nr:uncharacterized protein PHALS_12935 [Plasmopara halstedii]CEG42681.1 hypothetical protein PHALS_12935 [Plasmopara halstedii]|eukprot:XP_024579050.1 hypothetical protein PHALS_12935 [Plasmopara halstedii]
MRFATSWPSCAAGADYALKLVVGQVEHNCRMRLLLLGVPKVLVTRSPSATGMPIDGSWSRQNGQA